MTEAMKDRLSADLEAVMIAVSILDSEAEQTLEINAIRKKVTAICDLINCKINEIRRDVNR